MVPLRVISVISCMALLWKDHMPVLRNINLVSNVPHY